MSKTLRDNDEILQLLEKDPLSKHEHHYVEKFHHSVNCMAEALHGLSPISSRLLNTLLLDSPKKLNVKQICEILESLNVHLEQHMTTKYEWPHRETSDLLHTLYDLRLDLHELETRFEWRIDGFHRAFLMAVRRITHDDT